MRVKVSSVKVSKSLRIGAAAAGLALALVACDSSTEPSTSESGNEVSLDRIPGQFPAQEPNIPGGAIAPVGACVSFSGSASKANLTIVECGSSDNGYKVVQRVTTPEQCPGDVAQRFYMNPPEGQFTACLDYAWSLSDCLSIGKVSATRANCSDSTKPNREKPTKVILNTASNADCPAGGFTHPVRKFTVCTETQK
ncbi:hypothetical protein TPB0596_42270 [Tsukamurella pulmonis]|uniref:LppU/SCO3897 family protein n=1 Tax=Tsukamurella pulmonis TaxID=47312 RepID=UPI00308FFE6D|nr:hypothetical protein TPB0596_42270 [Tsukamurella pulmonis]